MMRVRRQIFINIDVVVWNIKVPSHKLQTANTVKYDSVEDMMKDLKA